jgi:ring-1,2-phenylacetyl-CoA epoxidase subunit PaaE
MTDDFLKLRIVRIKTEIGTASRPEANSYFLEPLNGQPVLYQAGQFLTLILTHNDHEVRRSYSLSSAPGEPLRLTIKRVINGQISRYLLDSLRVGDVLTSLQPAGRFTYDEQLGTDVVLIGAGSGITPLFSILKQVLSKKPAKQVTLLYSNSNERTVLFKDELNELQEQFPNQFRLFHLLSSPIDEQSGLAGVVRVGRLNNVMLERLIPELAASSSQSDLRYYVCGPGDYMRMVQFTLVFSGVRPEQIRRENFVVDPVVLTPPPVLAIDRTVLLRFQRRNAENYEVDIQVPAYKSILQAALDEGVMLPYSCRGGRCSTCAARCLSGRVYMTINDVLTERDLADGWILTCTSYPQSEGVVIAV